MRTPEAKRASALFGSALDRPGERPGPAWIVERARAALPESDSWLPVVQKAGGAQEHGAMCLALAHGEGAEVRPLTKEQEGETVLSGRHGALQIVFREGLDHGPVTTRAAVFKTAHVHRENRRYRESMDPVVTGPEREVCSYLVDRALGFDLVPPTVARDLEGFGPGSAQAWVNARTGWKWLADGEYDYRRDLRNPWLHRLAALDFVTGQIDRHANNFIVDAERRVYAIDNGYAFPKEDDRKWFWSNVGKRLVGDPVHPLVRAEIAAADPDAVASVLSGATFREEEAAGVSKRLRELQSLKVWRKLGSLW